MDPPQDNQEPEPTEPKAVLVTPIHAIKTMALSMVDAGCR
jgi:hypothetical protein